ncbi:MAG: carbon storage regulator [Planctomycetaceae bacterium]
MLVLTRRIGESIRVGDDIEIVVLHLGRGRVRLGFAAPQSVSLRRGELPARPERDDDSCERPERCATVS